MGGGGGPVGGFGRYIGVPVRASSGLLGTNAETHKLQTYLNPITNVYKMSDDRGRLGWGAGGYTHMVRNPKVSQCITSSLIKLQSIGAGALPAWDGSGQTMVLAKHGDRRTRSNTSKDLQSMCALAQVGGPSLMCTPKE